MNDFGFIYGTAWKEDRTSDLVTQALLEGFRAIDTANQRKHYFEEAVGSGLQRFLKEKGVGRESIFLQTKYTYARGQDHRLPYSEDDAYAKQVADSFASSLDHLGTDYIDSFVLHGPFQPFGFSEEDREVWAAMEELVDQKKALYLGVSNVTDEQLSELCSVVRIKPRFVQNRCFARSRWDHDVRKVCRKEGIHYQGFSLLTANLKEIETSQDIAECAKRYHKTKAQVVFRFCQQLAMLCLTGTTDARHMREDLAASEFNLTPEEMGWIENVSKRLKS